MQLNFENEKFSGLKTVEEEKYEKRLQLIKKIHEE